MESVILPIGISGSRARRTRSAAWRLNVPPRRFSWHEEARNESIGKRGSGAMTPIDLEEAYSISFRVSQ